MNHDDSLINRLNGVGRASEVVGVGIGEGMLDGLKNLPSHTAQIAESLGIGYAMGAAMHFGTPGKILALGAGAVMLGDWAYNEITGGRWQKIGAAVSDAYNSDAHMQQDIQTSREQLGSFAFDTALAFGTGGLGAKLGYSNFAADGIGTRLMSGTLGTTPAEIGAAGDSALASMRSKFSNLTGQTESTAYGLTLGADVAKGNTPFDAAAAILKPKQFNGLDQIKEAWANGQLEKDAGYTGLKGQLQDAVAQNQTHVSAIDRLTGEIKGHNKEITQWSQLLTEKNALSSAEQHVEYLKNQKEVVLPEQQQLLRGLDSQVQAEARARELAAKQQAAEGDTAPKGKPAVKQGQPGEQAGTVDLDALKQQRREVNQTVRDLVTETNEDAFRNARTRVANAQEALAQAQEIAPTKISELQKMIDAKQTEIGTHTDAIRGLAQTTSELLDQLQSRRTEVLDDPSKIIPLEQAQPVRKVSTAKAQESSAPVSGAGSDAAAATTPQIVNDGAAAKAPVVKENPVVSKATSDASSERGPVSDKVSPQLLLAKQHADTALTQAEQYIKPFQAERELRAARHSKTNIEQGKVRVGDKASAIESADVRIAKAETEVRTLGSTKYAQTVRSLRDYANTVGQYLAKEPDAAARETYARQAVIKLESMMPAVDNLYRGVKGGSDLPRLNINQPFDPLKRLGDIQNHLESRINQIDSNNLRRSSRLVNDNPVFAELSANLKDIPADGTLFFFNKDGELVKGPTTFQGKVVGKDGVRYRMDALNDDGTFTGRDGAVVTNPDGSPVKVATTYKAIDVSRWQQHGVDVNGAGIERFKGDDVAGAVLVRPKYDGSGRPIEIRRTGRGGKPTIAKEVVGSFGEVPDSIKDGMSLGNLMRTYDPEQIAARQKGQ
ncbi:MAG TPA: hypothetical protein V6C72_15035 [Chroococcales cyanobacterium]